MDIRKIAQLEQLFEMGMKIKQKIEIISMDDSQRVDLKDLPLFEELRVWVFKLECLFADAPQSYFRGEFETKINNIFTDSHALVSIKDVEWLVENMKDYAAHNDALRMDGHT